MTISSESLLICIEVIAEIDRNSITKSLSETASIELGVGAVKFNSFVVDSLSIGKAVPANAADPRGLIFNLFEQSSSLDLSLPNIST